MSITAAWPQVLEFFGVPLVIEPSPGQLSGEAGLLPIRQFDERIGFTWAFADALDDPRDPDLIKQAHHPRHDPRPRLRHPGRLAPRRRRGLAPYRVPDHHQH